MDNAISGEADCPGCGDSVLARAAKALDDSVVVVPYGQEATVKLPANVISRTMLQSLEREMARSGLDDGRVFTQPRISESAAAHTDDSMRARIRRPQASPDPFSIGDLTHVTGIARVPQTASPSRVAAKQPNPLQNMLTPRPTQHYRLEMTPRVGLQVQPVPIQPDGKNEQDKKEDQGKDADTGIPPGKEPAQARTEAETVHEGGRIRVFGGSREGFDELKGRHEEPARNPRKLKCGGKWRHTLDTWRIEKALSSEWEDEQDANAAARAAVAAVDAEDELSANEKNGAIESQVTSELQDRFGWKCEEPCKLKVTPVGYLYKLSVFAIVGLTTDSDTGEPYYEVWIVREHRLSIVFDAECVE
ncbi:MAG: hypothetical protein IT464_01870 [Planctomycetes bacterium]|nr:hypothetical protein [Planctomycetota bacterium]